MGRAEVPRQTRDKIDHQNQAAEETRAPNFQATQCHLRSNTTKQSSVKLEASKLNTDRQEGRQKHILLKYREIGLTSVTGKFSRSSETNLLGFLNTSSSPMLSMV